MEPIYVTKSFLPPIDEYIEEIKKIWETNQLTNQGPLHRELSNKIKELLLVNEATLFTNGHLALECAINCLPRKGEIITTPFSFASTTHAIVRSGCVPIFCDININDYTIDIGGLEQLINENTVAILPVHVYGHPCDVEAIEKIGKKHGLKIIYDAAHVFGVKLNGKPIASYGDISMFSFHATKIFHTIEGGVLAYNDLSLKEKFDQLKNFGIVGPESVVDIGMNAKMNEFQAAMGIVNLRYLSDQISKRKEIDELYSKKLLNVKGIKIIEKKNNIDYNYAYYPIIVEDDYPLTRDELFDFLAKNNIFARKYFYPLIPEYKCYEYMNFNVKDRTPNAKYISDRVMTLPLYGSLCPEQVDRICDIIVKNSKGL